MESPQTRYRKTGWGLIAAAAVLAVGLLAYPYLGRAPVSTGVAEAQAPASVAQEQAPAAPEPTAPAAPEPTAPAAPEPTAPAAPTAPQELGISKSIAPDLTVRSAQIVRFNLFDREEELVEFVFSGEIQSVEAADGFMLLGPRATDEAISTSAALVETNRRAVLVGFKAGTNVPAYTLAAVRSGAVSNLAGKVNLQAVIPLGARGALLKQGPTAAPALLWVSVDRTKEWITYVFDESLDQTLSPDPRKFGYYTRNGRLHLGQSLVSLYDRAVTIQFDRSGGDTVEDAVRYFVLDDAVKDLQGAGNTPRAVGNTTTKPDLVSVARIADTMFDYTFDEAVTEIKPQEFTVWTIQGARYQGSSYARPDARTVRVVFPQLRYVGEQVVLAAVGPEAAKAAESITSPNTVGAMRLSPAGRANGRVAAPELTSIDVDDDTGMVSYNFDRALSRQLTLDKIDPKKFTIVSSSGDIQQGLAVAAIGTNWVRILFNKDEVKDAVGAAVASGAVTDDEGNGNFLGSVLR